MLYHKCRVCKNKIPIIKSIEWVDIHTTHTQYYLHCKTCAIFLDIKVIKGVFVRSFLNHNFMSEAQLLCWADDAYETFKKAGLLLSKSKVVWKNEGF